MDDQKCKEVVGNAPSKQTTVTPLMAAVPIIPAPRRVLLIRHAERADAYGDICKERKFDCDLSELGKAQATALVDPLKPAGIVAVFCSPYLRCVRTIAPFASFAKLPVFIDWGWAECHPAKNRRQAQVSPVTLDMDELVRICPQIQTTYIPALRKEDKPIVETVAQLSARMNAALLHSLRHGDAGTIAIVTHAGPAAQLLRNLTPGSAPLAMEVAQVIDLTITEDQLKMILSTSSS